MSEIETEIEAEKIPGLILILFSCGPVAQRGPCPPHTPPSVRLLRMSDQLFAETST